MIERQISEPPKNPMSYHTCHGYWSHGILIVKVLKRSSPWRLQLKALTTKTDKIFRSGKRCFSWVFPKIVGCGTPKIPNHSFVHRVFHGKKTIHLGVPLFLETPSWVHTGNHRKMIYCICVTFQFGRQLVAYNGCQFNMFTPLEGT